MPEERIIMLEAFTWLKQSAFSYKADGLTVYIDPWGVPGEDAADLVVITHAHFDHYSPQDLERIRTPRTRIVAPYDVAAELHGDVTAVAPGDSIEVAGVHLQAVPAYNAAEDRLDKHPRANRWVGYLLTLGDRTYYHAGDTDHVPELETIRADVAFLPIGGGGNTMDAEEAAGLARILSPEVAVPMHYGFVVGAPSDADRFTMLSKPVRVQTFTPVNPFDQHA